MPAWKRSLFWEGLLFLIFFGILALISVINWEYEAKLFVPRVNVTEWTEIHLGQIMLGIALSMTLFASLVLWIVRLAWPGVTSSATMLVPLTLVAILLIFPSLFIVVLGPAAITMIEQMAVAPR